MKNINYKPEHFGKFPSHVPFLHVRVDDPIGLPDVHL